MAFTIPVAQTFTVASETVAGLRDVARLSAEQVWVRIHTAVRLPPGTRVGVFVDVTELGRALEVVAQVVGEDPGGLRAVVMHANLADMMVLGQCLRKDAPPAPVIAPALPPPTAAALAAAKKPTAATPFAQIRTDPTAGRAEPTPPSGPAAAPLAPPTLSGESDNIRELLVGNQAGLVSTRVVGIDLGTSNSCIALAEGGETQIINDADGRDTVPSVVSYPKSGAAIVGRGAIELLESEPERTVFGSKRFIGRPFNSDAVQRIIHRFPYKLVPDDNHYVAAEIDNRVTSLTDVSTRILEKLKRMAEDQTQQEIVRAVVTVPAYYNDNQRHAVKRAGALAGLQVERIVDEPTAAAIAFGVNDLQNDRKVLVYDLGGGTFDVSVLHIRGSEFKVLATSGDNFLGGHDFDDAIVDYVIKTYEEGYGHNVWSTHPGVRARFKRQAEIAKCTLSVEDSARIEVRNVPLTSQGSTDVLVNLFRMRLEQLVESLIERTIFYCKTALNEAGLQVANLDAVILVGGQTRMPFVRRRLKSEFGDLVRHDVDPVKAVAMGAALLAQSVEQGLPDVQLESVLPMTIGLASPDDPAFKPIIRRNTPLPVRESFDVTVPRSEWGRFSHDVFQGDSADIEDNEYLGTLEVYDLEPGQGDQIDLTIEFVLTKECLLKVYVTNRSNGHRTEVLLSNKSLAPSLEAVRASSSSSAKPAKASAP